MSVCLSVSVCLCVINSVWRVHKLCIMCALVFDKYKLIDIGVSLNASWKDI